jgi:hypothetical protein
MKCTCGASIGHPLVPKCTCKPKEVSELSDEKIMQVWQDSEWGDGEQEDILLFARALLKKASEK